MSCDGLEGKVMGNARRGHFGIPLVTLTVASALAPALASAEGRATRVIKLGAQHGNQMLHVGTVPATLIGKHAAPQADAREINERVASLQQRNGGQRGFHGSPSLAAAKVTLTPLPNLPAALQAILKGGLLSQQRSGIARFSHGNPNAKDNHQLIPDVRGLGLNFAVGNEIATLSGTNQPAQVVSTGVDFLRFFDGKLGPVSSFGRLPAGIAAKATGKLAKGTLPIESLFSTRYWAFPVVVGQDASNPEQKYAGRVVFMPEKPIGTSIGARLLAGIKSLRHAFSPHYLTEKAEQRLSRGDVKFTVGLQLYKDAQSTPLTKDGDKEWSVPTIPVATLTLKQLGPGEGEHLRKLTQEFLAAGPHIVPSPSSALKVPLVAVGEFQGARILAYDASQKGRGLPTETAVSKILAEIQGH